MNEIRDNPQKAGVWKIRPDGSGATRIFTGIVQIPELYRMENMSVGVFKRALTEGVVTLEVVRVEDGAHYVFRGGIIQQLTDALGGRSRWMPDGKRIAYLDQNEPDAWEIYVQDFVFGEDTSGSQTAGRLRSGLGHRIIWHFAGWFAHHVSEREQSSGLVLAENAPLD